MEGSGQWMQLGTTTTWWPRADIPNREGLKVVVCVGSVAKQRWFVTEVMRNQMGQHYLRDTPITSVLCWRPAQSDEPDLGSLHNTVELVMADAEAQ